MQEIADWLRKLGMSEYAQRFAENGIDVSALRHLTDQDLKDIGVLLGHRRKMLAAIGDLTPAAPAAPEPAPGTERKTPDTAERRQVTVMFCDLVGSTALSARMDPEDLREVISAYQKCVAETVRRFDGFVAKYMGDGVLVYFGYPQAHEDDAERAVRAGLKLLAAVADLKTGASLQTRVGIATGLVVVGDLIGSGEAQERGIVGETPNLAARLQGLAESNTVVIAESTRKLLGNLFELEDLGAKDLKGIAGPVRAWAALRASSAQGRFEALHASGLIALVGREEELELLLRRWSTAKTGEGQVVLLSGEAGIGKSRLTAALLESLAAEPHTRLRYFCSPQHTASAFYPIISQMGRAAGFTHDDAPLAKLDKLDAVLAQTSTSKQDAGLFAELLSLPNDGRYPTPDPDPQGRRQQTLEALTAQVGVLLRQNPCLMIFEDAHWADPTSLEAFSGVVDRTKNLRVLLVVTFRPDFRAPWIGRPHVTSVTLSRLPERDVAAMIDRIIGNKVLPTNHRQDIVERTDGIPLFVEEMTKAVLEAESQGAAEHAVAAVPSPALAVPASLHASLMARLDRLGFAKEVAQIGAVIGREFSHPVLAAVSRKTEVELRSALDRLIDAGLLFRQGMPPHSIYLFKHALVQDAAYGMLLRELRRTLHGRIANTLESDFPDIAENQPELLARHCTEAGLIEKAISLWGKAGLRSLEHSAFAEAAEQFTRALDQIATQPSTPELRREQIKFQVALMTALIHGKGYGAPETKAAAERARRLIERAEAIGESPEDTVLLFSTLNWLCVAYSMAFDDGDFCRDFTLQCLELAQKRGGTVPLMVGHQPVGWTSVYLGEFAQSRERHDQVIALYNPVEHRPLTSRFAIDLKVSSLTGRAYALWHLGYPEAALAAADDAVTDARAIDHVGTLMHTLAQAANVLLLLGSYARAKDLTTELIELASKHNAPFWKVSASLIQGILLLRIGKASDAVQMMTSEIDAYRSTGAKMGLTRWMSVLALAYAQLGKFDDAWRCIGEAITTVETTKQKVARVRCFSRRRGNRAAAAGGGCCEGRSVF